MFDTLRLGTAYVIVSGYFCMEKFVLYGKGLFWEIALCQRLEETMRREERRILLGAVCIAIVAAVAVLVFMKGADLRVSKKRTDPQQTPEAVRSDNPLKEGELTTVNSQGAAYETSGEVKREGFPWAIRQGKSVYLVGTEEGSGDLQVYQEDLEGKNREKKLRIANSAEWNIGKMVCNGRWLVMSYSTDRGVKNPLLLCDYRDIGVSMELQKGFLIINLSDWSVVNHKAGDGKIHKLAQLLSVQDFSIKGDILYYTYEYFDQNFRLKSVKDYKANKEYGNMEMEERAYHHGGRAEYSMVGNKCLVNEKNYGAVWSMIVGNQMMYRDRAGKLFWVTWCDEKGRDKMQIIYNNEDLGETFFSTVSLLGIRDGKAYYSRFNKETRSIEKYCFDPETGKEKRMEQYRFAYEEAKMGKR